MQLDNTEEAEEGKRGGRYESCPFWRTLEKYAAERVKGDGSIAADIVGTKSVTRPRIAPS